MAPAVVIRPILELRLCKDQASTTPESGSLRRMLNRELVRVTRRIAVASTATTR
jgi:hypothetical protein